jgi:hypothetical protein
MTNKKGMAVVGGGFAATSFPFPRRTRHSERSEESPPCGYRDEEAKIEEILHCVRNGRFELSEG